MAASSTTTQGWVAVLRAVAVLIQRHGGIEEIELLPIPERAKRVELRIEVDRETLLQMMKTLEEKFGKPPGPRVPTPLRLTGDQRLQEQYRAAGETH